MLNFLTTKYSKEWLLEEELKKMLSLPDLEEKYEIWLLIMYAPALRVSEVINVIEPICKIRHL